MKGFPFYSPEYERSKVDSPDFYYGQDVIGILDDPILEQEINAGNITLAMVRPGLDGATTIVGVSDEIVAFEVETEIEGLGVAAKFSVVFDEEAITAFYNESREAQLQKPAERPGHSNRWLEFSSMMSNGPTTVLLLHTNHGDAIQRWRDQVGHWNIEANRDPATIRGRLGVDNYNNLVHGSDSIESAKREIGILSELIKRHS